MQYPILIPTDDQDQYLVTNAHFEMGKSVHTDTFIDTNKFFQNSTNCQFLADLLVNDICIRFPDLKEVTLLGMSNSLSMLLNKTVAGLQKQHPTLQSVNYGIIERDRESFGFTHSLALFSEVVLIMPVTRTFERYFRIKEYLENTFESCKILKDFYSMFLGIDEALYNELKNPEKAPVKIYNLHDSLTREFYTTHNWSQISSNDVDFTVSDADGDLTHYKGIYFDTYSSNIFLSEKCLYCFPEKAKMLGRDPLDYPIERPLIRTTLNHDALITVLGLPKFADTGDDEEKVRPFKSVLKKSAEGPVHLYGHLKFRNYSHLNFIQRDLFYQTNQVEILKYFHQELENYRTDIHEKQIVIITPGHFRNSGFLDDLVESKAFGDNKINIIPYKPEAEYLENFIAVNDHLFQRCASFIYFDDVIAGGQTFKLISDFLKNTRYQKSGIQSEPDKGFDLLLTLVDRTTVYAKQDIYRKLARAENPSGNGMVKAFFKLNVPQIDLKHIGNPINERHRTLTQIFDVSHLDALKEFGANEIVKGAPKNIEELLITYGKNVLRYFPFMVDPDSFSFYKNKYNYEYRNQLKLHLFHDISKWLANHNGSFTTDSLLQLFNSLTEERKRNEYFHISQSDAHSIVRIQNESLEKDLIIENILKILCRSPFRDFREIHSTVLSYNNAELNKALDTIFQLHQDGITNGDKPGINKLRRIRFENFRLLKSHIKRSAELNSNFILSRNFLSRVQKTFMDENRILKFYEIQMRKLDRKNLFESRKYENFAYQKSEVIHFKYFLLHAYKELVFKSPTRSIVLEELLNANELQISLFNEHEKKGLRPLSQIITDSYYQLRRILKSENTFLLNELKNYQLSTSTFVNSILKVDLDPNHTFPQEGALSLARDLLVHLDFPDRYQFMAEFMEDSRFMNNLGTILSETLQNRKEAVARVKEALVKYAMYLRYFRPSSANEDISRQARIFLLPTRYSGEILFDDAAISPVLSMLFTTALLQNPESSRQLVRTKQSEEDSFVSEVKRILHSATSIIGRDLEYAFFIEYRTNDADEHKNSDHIFSIISNEIPENRTIKLCPDGLIYNMLYGLRDYEDGNLQSFIAVAKQGDDKILSLKEDYIGSGINGEIDVVVNEAFVKDYQRGETGLVMIENAQMVQLYRFASFDTDNKKRYTQAPKGQAVLAICSKNTVTSESFMKFADVDRMRLLLLLKKEMLSYLEKHFESDAFIALLEDRGIFEFRDHLDHGVGNYNVAINAYYEQIDDTLDDEIIELPELKLLLKNYSLKINLIMNAIIGQFNAGRDIKDVTVTPTALEFKNRLKMILSDGYLGSNMIRMNEIRLPEVYPEKISKHVFDIILLEILINLKKHCPLYYDGNQGISIDYVDNTLIFRNRIREKSKFGIKSQGGVALCKEIIRKLNLEEMVAQPSSDGEFFEVKIKLYKL